MGLDSYFVVGSVASNAEIHYFRKFHALHEILEEEWVDQKKGRTGCDFNCVYLRIGKRILKILRKACKQASTEKYLQCDYMWEDKWKELESLCDVIENLIAEGQRVYYL